MSEQQTQTAVSKEEAKILIRDISSVFHKTKPGQITHYIAGIEQYIENSTPTVEPKSIHDCVSGIRDIWNNIPSCTSFYMIELEIYHELKLYAQKVTQDLQKENNELKETVERLSIKLDQLTK